VFIPRRPRQFHPGAVIEPVEVRVVDYLEHRGSVWLAEPREELAEGVGVEGGDGWPCDFGVDAVDE